MKTTNSNEKPDYLQPVMQTITHTPLQKIVQKAHFLSALDQHIKNILPEHFTSQCTVMNVDQQTIIIGTKNAAITARLQFSAKDILLSIQQSKKFGDIKNLKFRVMSCL